MDDVTSITAALADIDAQLRALPDDAFVEKHELLTRQDELRGQLAHLQADDLAHAKKQWDSQAGAKRRDDSQDVGMVVSPIEPAGGA